jgi:hypothetical protein
MRILLLNRGQKREKRRHDQAGARSQDLLGIIVNNVNEM